MIATRPARQPFKVIPRSGFPRSIQAVTVAVIVANAAAVFVVTATCEITFGITAIVLPGLNPNQPNQRTKQPMVASDMLWPGIAVTLPSAEYFPIRGPSTRIPVRASNT